jgi:hypothetical protein
MLKYKTREDTRVKFYKVIVASVLMYGSENWALNSSERSKIEIINALFKVYLWIYTNRQVHNMTMCNALQIYSLEERIQDYKNKWLKTS